MNSSPATPPAAPAAGSMPALTTDPGAWLSVLAQCPGEALKPFVEERLLPALPAVKVLHNASGLLMLPARDTAQGAVHHLGEVLVSEARILLGGVEGYGARLGADLELAVAAAIVDAAVQAGLERPLVAAFLEEQWRRLEAADARVRAQVRATRVEMETF